jgi:hypothetical protein
MFINRILSRISEQLHKYFRIVKSKIRVSVYIHICTTNMIDTQLYHVKETKRITELTVFIIKF